LAIFDQTPKLTENFDQLKMSSEIWSTANKLIPAQPITVCFYCFSTSSMIEISNVWYDFPLSIMNARQPIAKPENTCRITSH
jgi:hypothetical protein